MMSRSFHRRHTNQLFAPENPPGFVVRTEAQKAAWDNGYRIERGAASGWLCYTSTTAPGAIWIAGAAPHVPWLLSIEHSGVAAEIGPVPLSPVPGPGIATYSIVSLGELHAVLDRIYKLAVSLPDAPLDRFRKATAGLPQSTEAERLVLQRIGQDIFRAALIKYWGGCCPLTGIADLELLRASHIVPWSDCGDEERLDVHNGLLLSALWDAAFDKGLVSFADDGAAIASARLGETARQALGFDRAPALRGLREAQCLRIAWHRSHVFQRREGASP
jgi:hypothetical protein